VGPVRLPLAGGAYLRFLPAPIFRLGVQQLASAERATVLYVHPWEVDPDQPRQNVGWVVRLNHYHNLSRTQARLARLLRDHPFRPMGEVLEHLESQGRLPAAPLERALRAA
jgi:hypothetical protein